MALTFVLCREYIDDAECTVALGAETQEEVIEAAVEHASITHAQEDTPELRERIRNGLREGQLTA
jgi:predicted small metal-binding protein